jgi:membrane associated rhomboid family serine protease
MVFLFRFVFLMWLVFSIRFFTGWDMGAFSIYPRTISGLLGILTAPLIHGSVVHIVSNTIPLLFLGWTLFFFHEKIAKRVFVLCYFATNLLVWVFARSSLHIGASGIVYGIACFLMLYGFFKKDFKSLIISAIVIFFYGGMAYGLFPNQPGISWESHLLGAIVGGYAAMYYARNDRQKASY